MHWCMAEEWMQKEDSHTNNAEGFIVRVGSFSCSLNVTEMATRWMINVTISSLSVQKSGHSLSLFTAADATPVMGKSLGCATTSSNEIHRLSREQSVDAKQNATPAMQFVYSTSGQLKPPARVNETSLMTSSADPLTLT